MKYVAMGYSDKEIAPMVDMTEDGVKYHIKVLREIFGGGNRVQLAVKIVLSGTMELDEEFYNMVVPEAMRR